MTMKITFGKAAVIAALAMLAATGMSQANDKKLLWVQPMRIPAASTDAAGIPR